MRIYVISLPFSGVSSTLCGIRRGVFRRPFTINFFHQDTQAWCWKGQGRAASARRPCGCSLPAQSVSTGVPSGSFYASCLGALGFVCELIWCFFCWFFFFCSCFVSFFFFFPSCFVFPKKRCQCPRPDPLLRRIMASCCSSPFPRSPCSSQGTRTRASRLGEQPANKRPYIQAGSVSSPAQLPAMPRTVALSSKSGP